MTVQLTTVLVIYCSLSYYTSAADVKYEEFAVLMPHVKPSTTETYLCSTVKLDEERTYYITDIKPNATSLTVHHMILFGCVKPKNYNKVWDCGQSESSGNYKLAQVCPDGLQVIHVWAKDAPEIQLPPGVGLITGNSTKYKYLVLQVHYHDVTKFVGDVTDDSGMILTYTETPTPGLAGIYMLTSGGSIPAGGEGHLEAACDFHQDRDVHPIAFRAHTHDLGKLVSGYKVTRNGQKYEWTLLGKKNPQLPQMFYPVNDTNVVIKKGDVIASRCTLYNNRSTVTNVGLTYDDAMCYFYLLFWINGTNMPENDICHSLGPPAWGWKDYPLDNIPPDASTPGKK
uniref:peptidylglycine monooxygenase n=1 Tax=Strigamia maritima TaxID=126957 RepID=T1IZZ8_STRMM